MRLKKMALAATAGIVTPVAFLATPAAAEGRTAGIQAADVERPRDEAAPGGHETPRPSSPEGSQTADPAAVPPRADDPSDAPTAHRETAQETPALETPAQETPALETPAPETPAQDSKPIPEASHRGVATPDADTGADSEPDADADPQVHVVDVPDEFLAGGDWSYFRYLIRHVTHDGNYTVYMELFDTTTTLRGEDVEAQFYVNGAWGPAARFSEDYLGFVILDGVELHEDTDIPVRLKFKDGTSLGTFVISASFTDGKGGDCRDADVPSEIVARQQEGSGQEGGNRPGGDGSGEDGREGGDQDGDGRPGRGHEEDGGHTGATGATGTGGSGSGAKPIASPLTKSEPEHESKDKSEPLTTFAPEEHGTGDSDGAGHQLAHTGTDAASSWALGSGGVALLLGSAFVAAARRKQGRPTV